MVVSRQALVLGAGDEPGISIALSLSNAGWSLVLQDDGGSRARSILRRRLRDQNCNIQWIASDLRAVSGRAALVACVTDAGPVDLVIQSTRTSDNNTLEQLISTCYLPLIDLSRMHRLENTGKINWIALTEVKRTEMIWSDRDAVSSLIEASLNHRRDVHGDQSAILRLSESLVAGEIAEAVMSVIDGSGGVFLVEPGEPVKQIEAERLPLRQDDVLPVETPVKNSLVNSGIEQAPDISQKQQNIERRLRLILQHVLKLNTEVNPAQGGLGITPGWDSLKQIEIILAVEKEFGFRFQAAEIGSVKLFRDLSTKIAERISG